MTCIDNKPILWFWIQLGNRMVCSQNERHQAQQSESRGNPVALQDKWNSWAGQIRAAPLSVCVWKPQQPLQTSFLNIIGFDISTVKSLVRNNSSIIIQEIIIVEFLKL